MTDKFILDGHNVKPVDLMQWAEWYETADRTVAKTAVGDVDVSTVFLSMDHSFGDGPPLLFETMIFGGKHDQYQDRYETWDQAEAGHEKAVKMVQS